MVTRKPGLRMQLGEGEPVLTLFSWFFPMQMYMDHLEELSKRKPGPKDNRHHIPWDQGTFLRFLGILIRMAVMPAPNLEWHWRWPESVPDLSKWGSAKQWMSEVVWFRYWKYACIPGITGGIVDNEVGEDGRTAVYNALKTLLNACVATW